MSIFRAARRAKGLFARLASLLMSLVLPDFQLFNVIDAVIEGQALPMLAFGKLTLVGAVLRALLHHRVVVHLFGQGILKP